MNNIQKWWKKWRKANLYKCCLLCVYEMFNGIQNVYW